MEQATKRLCRAGQKREVTVYKPIMDCEFELNTLTISEPLAQKTMGRDITKRDIAVTLADSTLRALLSLQ
jgi:SNF2 family DNA or RNA helicase